MRGMLQQYAIKSPVWLQKQSHLALLKRPDCSMFETRNAHYASKPWR